MTVTTGVGSAVLIAHPGAELYGSDLVLLETVSALVGSGTQVTVALPTLGPLVGELTSRGAHIELCPTPVLRKSILRPVGALRFLRDALRGMAAGIRLLRRVHPAVLYVNTVTLPLWVLLGRAARIPVIIHVHEAERSASGVVRRALAAPLLLCDTVVSNSQYCIDVLCESYPRLRERARVVRNPIGWPGQTVNARSELVGRLQLLYVGRLSERKGVDTAVLALSAYRSTGHDAELHLVGDIFPGYEWYLDRLRELVRTEGLSDRVHFHGYQRDVWPFLAQSDIVLVPSVLEEGFGNTAVEGALAARPVVVSDTSGLREASAGFASAVRVPPGASAAVASALGQIVADWPHYRLAAGTDQFLARDRHGLAGYRSSIRDTVLAAGRSPAQVARPAAAASGRPEPGRTGHGRAAHG
ncbi:glycosyltransferase [Cryobacterium sp. SO2]|uniref:glycosyltransferase n=1 Tax=Cryobacterium sp. SO2 TaxID=1897060 RepID=UPI00223C9DD7|nr:glycosyltransferase [Cryobacterium sp. SO2]WEO76941.1 glycosyltransferase [Cryobacterium sp. SO2]